MRKKLLRVRLIYTWVRFCIRLVHIFKKAKKFCSYEWAKLTRNRNFCIFLLFTSFAGFNAFTNIYCIYQFYHSRNKILQFCLHNCCKKSTDFMLAILVNWQKIVKLLSLIAIISLTDFEVIWIRKNLNNLISF